MKGNNMITNTLYKEDVALIASSQINWNALENSKILITGATGLICSFLVDVLMYRNKYYDSNISIYALNRNNTYAEKRFAPYFSSPLFNYIQQNIVKRFDLNTESDFIIHGASNAYPASFVSDPVGTIKANLWGLSNLLDYSAHVKSKRVLYISSGEIYGEGDGNDFVESYSGYIDPLNPRSCYPSSKRAAETLCVSYSHQYGADVVIARPCHIYGPTITNSDNRAFAQFIRNVLLKQDIVLKSNGAQYRSYCYVADCVSALLTILLSGEKGMAYNIADKKSNVSIAELAKTIALAGGQNMVFNIPPSEEQRGYSVISRSILNSDKLESLGWKANYTLPDGIRRTIQILSAGIL
jgi:nucleoside-diphosphate-sugar epimerase